MSDTQSQQIDTVSQASAIPRNINNALREINIDTDASHLLNAALRRGKLCIVTGAGVSSSSANLPGWYGILDNAILYSSEILHLDPHTITTIKALLRNSPLVAAHLIRELLGVSFGHWLLHLFANPVIQNDTILKAIRRLKDKGCHIATTNYDTILDRFLGLASLDWSDPQHHLDSFTNGHEPSRLLHLHGTYSIPNTVIFSLTDYAILEGLARAHTSLDVLSSVLSSFTILFIGCGGTVTDPHFARIFKSLLRPGSASPKHVLLYRREPGNTDPAPQHEDILAISHGDYAGLVPKLASLFPEVFADQPAVIVSVPEPLAVRLPTRYIAQRHLRYVHAGFWRTQWRWHMMLRIQAGVEDEEELTRIMSLYEPIGVQRDTLEELNMTTLNFANFARQVARQDQVAINQNMTALDGTDGELFVRIGEAGGEVAMYFASNGEDHRMLLIAEAILSATVLPIRNLSGLRDLLVTETVNSPGDVGRVLAGVPYLQE